MTDWPTPHLTRTQPLLLEDLVASTDGLECLQVTSRRTQLGEYVYEHSTIAVLIQSGLAERIDNRLHATEAGRRWCKQSEKAMRDHLAAAEERRRTRRNQTSSKRA